MNYLRLLIAILLIKLVAAALFLHYGELSLAPDEAQYWTWSQQLDWGYYSKPPGVAWQIALGTAIFGNTEFGVRAVPLLLAPLLSLGIYGLAAACTEDTRVRFWAALAFTLSPMGMIASILSTTDGGFILFWTFACVPVARALGKAQEPPYLIVGALVAAGALFKWPIYLLWIPIIFATRSPKVLKGILVSTVGLLPSLLWNLSNDWATFRHVGSTIAGGSSSGAKPGNPLEFIGAQIGLLSPVFFGLLALALIHFWRHRKSLNRGLHFCLLVTLCFLLPYSLLSFVKRMQGNWVAFAYPTGSVLLAAFAIDRVKHAGRWMTAGSVFAVVSAIAVLIPPLLQSHSVKVAGLEIPYKLNAFRHNLGWGALTEQLAESGFDPKEHFLFGDTYQMTSVLSFYGPDQQRAYFLNHKGRRKNQFSYWPSLQEERAGQTGYYVYAENQPRYDASRAKVIRNLAEEFAPYFESVTLVYEGTLFSAYDKRAKGALIFRCDGYTGVLPEDPEVY